MLFIDTVLDSVTGSQDSSGGQVWRCIVIVCVCVVNFFADLFFCIVPEQNHNDHYQYFTSVMQLYFCVCSFVVGTVVDSTL